MAVSYRWDSPKSMDAVLKSLQYKTDRETRSFSWRLYTKLLENGIRRITLSYATFSYKSYTYRQPSLQGIIEHAGEGCRVSAVLRFDIDNAFKLVMLGMLYVMAAFSIFADFSGGWLVAIIIALMATALLAWFLYTRHAHRGEQLRIMDEAAGVPHIIIQ